MYVFPPSAILADTKPVYHTSVPSLFDITLDQIGYGLDKGSFSSAQLVKAYLARIEEVNNTFRAVIEVNPDAFRIAQHLDNEMRTSGRRG